jgi:hypothetical protein
MADYCLWATVTQAAAHEFAVTVSAVPTSSNDVNRAQVDMQIAATLEIAETMRAAMLLAMGERIRARGNRVVDVEE